MDKKDHWFVAKWSKKIRAIRMMGGKCRSCGESNELVIEFHHDIDEKENKVSRLAASTGLGGVLVEASKCILLCANCHADLHFKNGRASKRKLELVSSLTNGRCSKCGRTTKSSASMEFHHRGEKRFHVADALARKEGVSVAELVEEIGKCDLVCRNCHRLTTIDTEAMARLRPEINRRVVNGMRRKRRPDVERMVELRRSGMGVCGIATRLGCGKSTVSEVLKRMGLRHGQRKFAAGLLNEGGVEPIVPRSQQAKQTGDGEQVVDGRVGAAAKAASF